MPATVIVTGLAQLQRDLDKSGDGVGTAMRKGLHAAAEPVANMAQGLQLSRISRMPRSPQWSETRIGVTRSAVYIVPKQRGVRGRGQNSRRRGALIKGGGLVPLVMERAYTPALEAGAPLTERIVSGLLKEVLR